MIQTKGDPIGSPFVVFLCQFGSAGRLQGTIDLGNVSQLATNLYGPKLNETVTTLNHELMHRFGAYVRFKNPDGTLNTGLLGKDSAHWSYLLDSKGSLMYGSGWKDNGDGTFTATAARNAYSPLDLYLMGMIPKEQVPPMLIIDNPAIDKTQMPQLGATVTGSTTTVAVDDIIAAEGARLPDAATAPKQFNVGFVLLTRAGDNSVSAAAAIETLRKAWAGRFAELTQGKGSIGNITPSLEIAIDSPLDNATITGPDVTVSGTVINSSGAETGITVNGMPATVSGNRFRVNHVPLVEGANSIEIMATDANGLMATTTRNITSGQGHYIRITTNVESGSAPLNVSLRLGGSFIITNPVVTITGPVPSQLVGGASPTEYSTTLTAEGSYTIFASAIGSDGQTYSNTVTVTVVSRTQLDTLLKAKWDGLKLALSAKNLNDAAKYFESHSSAKYLEIYTLLFDYLPQLASEMKEIEMVKAVESGAKYRIKRDEVINGVMEEIMYYIYFVKNENGIWQIDQF